MIDDDALVRATWLAAAAVYGHRILALAVPSELDDHEVDPATSVFVDLNLAGGVSGLGVAANLSAAGFTGIFLTTGSKTVKSQPLPDYIKSIVGKEYPLSES